MRDDLHLAGDEIYIFKLGDSEESLCAKALEMEVGKV